MATCNSSLIFFAGQTNLSNAIDPLMLVTAIVALTIVAVCTAVFISQKPYYDRLKVRHTMLVILTGLGVVAQVVSGPLASLSNVTFNSYPCWLRLLIMVLVPTLVGSSFLVRMMIFHFMSNLSRVAIRHHRNLLDGDDSIKGFLATACTSMKTGITSLFRTVEATREPMLALKFLISIRGQLLITFVISLPYLFLVLIVAVVVPEYREGCTGCKLFPNVFIAFAIATFGFALQCTLLFCKIRHESDYWGLGRELYYSIFAVVAAAIGFLLSFLVLNQFQVVQTVGFALVIIPQTVYPVYIARKIEGKRKVRKNKVMDQRLTQQPISSNDAGTSVMNANAVKINLKQVMETPELFAAFEHHLTSELAVESLLFLKDATLWRDTYETDSNRTATAKKLYKTYVQMGSVLEINVSHKMRMELDRMVMQVEPGSEVPKNAFDATIKEITFLVQTGPLIRFVNSPAYVNEFGDKYSIVPAHTYESAA